MVKIVDAAGKVTFEAIESKELLRRQKAADEAYAKVEKAWQEAVKADPTAPKPARMTFTVIQSGITGSDAKQKAEAAATRCREEFEKKQKEAAAKT